MHFDLHCTCCVSSFRLRADSIVVEVLEKIAEEESWLALGDGETIEDKVNGILFAQNVSSCPECGQPGIVSEESLGRLTRQLLMQW